MKFLIFGCGSIGERHISNIINNFPQNEIDVFDENIQRMEQISSKFDVNVIEENAIESKYDCVFVCTPPISHLPLAIRAMKAGSNVFVEKPLSINLNGINELKQLSIEKNKHVFVGFNFRFNKGIKTVKEILKESKLGKPLHISSYFGQFLPDWRPNQDYSLGYTANQNLGGGIVHDGSHEIDYLVWLFDNPISLKAGYGYTDSLKVNTEAIADILLKFDNNILGRIHLDFIRREYKRSLEILCEKGIIKWSLSKNRIKIFESENKSWKEIILDESINDMYVNEIKHIIECIKNNTKSEIIDLENGINTLKLSIAIHDSEKSGNKISIN